VPPMPRPRPIHPDFQRLLDEKSDALIALFTDLRAFVLDVHPGANELLYHTHALTAVFSPSAPPYLPYNVRSPRTTDVPMTSECPIPG
jgi:hypothetical protein